MRRREFVSSLAALSLGAGSASGDNRGYKHKHTGGASGTGSHIYLNGSEASFRKGDLMRQLRMPPCVLIIHHAGLVETEEFDIVDYGVEQYAIWVREDAALSEVSTANLRALFSGRAPLVDERGREMSVVRLSSAKKIHYEAFKNAVRSIDGDDTGAVTSSTGLFGYDELREATLKDDVTMSIGYRNGSYAGMKPLLVNGIDPFRDWEDYPIRTPTLAYIRKGSERGALLHSKFDEILAENRDRDRQNFSEWAGLLHYRTSPL